MKKKNDKIESSEKEILKQQMREAKLLLQQIKTETGKSAQNSTITVNSTIADAVRERRRLEALSDPNARPPSSPMNNATPT